MSLGTAWIEAKSATSLGLSMFIMQAALVTVGGMAMIVMVFLLLLLAVRQMAEGYDKRDNKPRDQ